MEFRVRIFLPVAAAFAVSACGTVKPSQTDKPEAKAKSEAPELIGRIASTPADKRFVLIQSYGSWNIQTGTILTTRGPEQRSANLLVTGESLGHFAAADLQSGLVEVGDAVYSHHAPKPVEPPSQPETTTQPTDNQLEPKAGKSQKIN